MRRYSTRTPIQRFVPYTSKFLSGKDFPTSVRQQHIIPIRTSLIYQGPAHRSAAGRADISYTPNLTAQTSAGGHTTISSAQHAKCGINRRQKEKRRSKDRRSCWRYLSFQAVASQVLSTEMSLTTVFGMGTGGPSS